ncbi:MAG: DNA-processing protein DprA [Bacteroidota bacterium]
MNTDQLQLKIALTQLKGIGYKKAMILISELGSLEKLFAFSVNELHKETGFSKKLLMEMDRKNALEIAHREMEFIMKNNVQVHFILDESYPRRLKQCVDPPLLIYTKGNVDLNPARTIAIVGTRDATDYGKDLCQLLVADLAEAGVQVISGLAYGIDICAHKACLSKDLQTIGVLGNGLSSIYPANHRKIADQMLYNGGLISEFLSFTKPDRENFPMRNRIVAGMADATIVIESKQGGGSLITAELALDYNRDVFAFPGNVTSPSSEGCNQLIRESKAHLVSSGQDVLKFMGWQNSSTNKAAQTTLLLDLEPEEMEIVEQLDGSIEHIDVLALRMKKPVSALNVLLLTMEIKGLIRSFPGSKYGLLTA